MRHRRSAPVGPTTTPTRPSRLSLRACSQADCGDENRKRIDADRIKMAPTIAGATSCLPWAGEAGGVRPTPWSGKLLGLRCCFPRKGSSLNASLSARACSQINQGMIERVRIIGLDRSR